MLVWGFFSNRFFLLLRKSFHEILLIFIFRSLVSGQLQPSPFSYPRRAWGAHFERRWLYSPPNAQWQHACAQHRPLPFHPANCCPLPPCPALPCQNCDWVPVFVDNQFPCGPECKPIFAQGHDPNELWPLLIEKAYAKLHGSYEASGV